MSIYEICNFDDIRFVSYIMLEERLIKLTKDFFASLRYWTEEIRIKVHKNWLTLKKFDFMVLTLQKIILLLPF